MFEIDTFRPRRAVRRTLAKRPCDYCQEALGSEWEFVHPSDNMAVVMRIHIECEGPLVTHMQVLEEGLEKEDDGES